MMDIRTLAIPNFVEIISGSFISLDTAARNKAFRDQILWKNYTNEQQRNLQSYFISIDEKV
jgi:hypothetical protein